MMTLFGHWSVSGISVFFLTDIVVDIVDEEDALMIFIEGGTEALHCTTLPKSSKK